MQRGVTAQLGCSEDKMKCFSGTVEDETLLKSLHLCGKWDRCGSPSLLASLFCGSDLFLLLQTDSVLWPRGLLLVTHCPLWASLDWNISIGLDRDVCGQVCVYELTYMHRGRQWIAVMFGSVVLQKGVPMRDFWNLFFQHGAIPPGAHVKHKSWLFLSFLLLNNMSKV